MIVGAHIQNRSTVFYELKFSRKEFFIAQKQGF
jgi:hypothetical protein